MNIDCFHLFSLSFRVISLLVSWAGGAYEFEVMCPKISGTAESFKVKIADSAESDIPHIGKSHCLGALFLESHSDGLNITEVVALNNWRFGIFSSETEIVNLLWDC